MGFASGWGLGIRFTPEACLGTDGLDGYWWDDCGLALDVAPTDGDDGSHVKPRGSRPQPELWMPYGIVEADHCSSDGWSSEDYQGRVRRLVQGNQSRKMEAELWTGAVAQAAGMPNDWLANPATVTDLGTLPLVYALAELQQFLADTVTGRGMIHVPVRLYTLWLSAGVVRREGNLVYDGMDNVVVPGSGYDGSGPGWDSAPGDEMDSEHCWAYATGMVQVLEDQVLVTPDSWGAAVDRATNDIDYRGERAVMAYFDGCAHAGVEVDLCSTCCTPGSSSGAGSHNLNTEEPGGP